MLINNMTSATLCGQVMYSCMNCPGMCVHVCVQLYIVLVHVVSICVSVHVGTLTHLSLFMVNTSVSLHKIKMMRDKHL